MGLTISATRSEIPNGASNSICGGEGAEGNSGACFGPMAQGVRRIGIGRIAVGNVHSGLILYRPRNIGRQTLERDLDPSVSVGAEITSVEVDNIDIAIGRGPRALVKRVPDHVPDEASADPTIGQVQSFDQTENAQHGRLLCDKAAEVGSAPNPVMRRARLRSKVDLAEGRAPYAGTLTSACHSMASKAVMSLRKRWPPRSTKSWQAKRYQTSSSTNIPS